jgi:hypothetical protein
MYTCVLMAAVLHCPIALHTGYNGVYFAESAARRAARKQLSLDVLSSLDEWGSLRAKRFLCFSFALRLFF